MDRNKSSLRIPLFYSHSLWQNAGELTHSINSRRCRRRTRPKVLVLAGVAVVGTGAFFARQAANNPVAMMAKIAAMANPNLEVLGVDEGTGKVTIKDKETGRTVTVSLDDLKNG